MKFTAPQHFSSLDAALESLFGNGVKAAHMGRVFGGDINEAHRLALTDGTHIFMKENTEKNAAFFTAEAAGLAAIEKTGTIRTPHVFCTGTDREKGRAFLLMEFMEEKARIPDYWEIFAHQLAAMHKAETKDYVAGGKYGFLSDNFIGAGKQENRAHDSWISFFRDCRLEPQFRRAAGYFDKTEIKKIHGLLEKTDTILIEPEYPSLLHGDLWGGNFITGNDGRAWLIDPAVYVGHAEADLAMTELFGGFAHGFYAAYEEAAPLQPGYNRRRDLYNLYHMLNHLNLFGRSYLSSVMRIIRAYAA